MAFDVYGARARPVAITLVVAATCWVIAVTQMRGMDMGVETGLGSFGFFVGIWAAMMAAMMLPGASAAVTSYARTHRRYGAPLLFLSTYVGVWTLFGLAAYVIYRPHGTVAAGAVTVAAGLYELTPIKQHARERCQRPVRSGFQFGLHCVVSSIGLMVLLLALGAMSIGWMTAIAAVVLMQKLIPPHRIVDITLALALVAFGVLIFAAPSSVPGLMPSM